MDESLGPPLRYGVAEEDEKEVEEEEEDDKVDKEKEPPGALFTPEDIGGPCGAGSFEALDELLLPC